MQSKQGKEISRVNEKIGRKFLAASSSEGKSIRKIDSGKNLFSEVDFIKFWQTKLAASPFNGLQSDDLLVIHLFFKLFKCFILSDATLFDSWLEALGWKKVVSTCVAQPTWIRGEDCSELSAMCTSEDSPTILKVQNFNSAMLEGYLFPLILPWYSTEEFVDRKVALISAPNEDSIKDAVFHFPFMEMKLGKLEHSPVLSKDLDANKIPEGPFFISTLAIWNEKQTLNYEENRDILNILNSEDIELPPIVLQNYTRLKSSLEQYFDLNSAIFAAFQLTILPWIKHCKNEIYADQIMQNMRAVYG
ncbi:MAG: hypothetical protein IPK68_22630 [Bdellovibrionales bacterium]|nr:hypothetical protein [Bdellovibrionales bacterium]